MTRKWNEGQILTALLAIKRGYGFAALCHHFDATPEEIRDLIRAVAKSIRETSG